MSLVKIKIIWGKERLSHNITVHQKLINEAICIRNCIIAKLCVIKKRVLSSPRRRRSISAMAQFYHVDRSPPSRGRQNLSEMSQTVFFRFNTRSLTSHMILPCELNKAICIRNCIIAKSCVIKKRALSSPRRRRSISAMAQFYHVDRSPPSRGRQNLSEMWVDT
jgi:hypothetical protein